MNAQTMLLADGTQILVVHFLYQSPSGTTRVEGTPLVAGAQTWKIACAPALAQMSAAGSRSFPWLRSDDPRAVTCPLCQESLPFQKARDVLEAHV